MRDAGVRGMWSIKASTMSKHDSYLVITFVSATHILAMNGADELDEASIEGFNTDVMTLFCGSLDNDNIIQACPHPHSTYASIHTCSCLGSGCGQSTLKNHAIVKSLGLSTRCQGCM
jgi:hypothetical protein